jgi:hypothetical protein
LIYSFAPTSAGVFSSAVTITSDGGGAGFALTGIGVNIPLRPKQVDFLSPWGLGMLVSLITVLMVRRRG